MKQQDASFELSVILCTRNPRKHFLEMTIDGLRKQRAEANRWELIVVDNGSDPPVESLVDLSWHPHGRFVIETTEGITFARLRGMREAASDLILFVDDDNVLDSDYFEEGLEKAQSWPTLGCWGGQLLGEFAEDPEEWTQQWWAYLAIRPLERDLWTNVPFQYEVIPPTAGMFVRRSVWEAYTTIVEADSRHLLLGYQQGERLTTGEDTDLALTAIDLGLGLARFRDLKLRHLMPSHRLNEEYLVELVEAINFSTVIVEALWGRKPRRGSYQGLNIFVEVLQSLRLPRRSRRFRFAELRGRRRGVKVVREEFLKR